MRENNWLFSLGKAQTEVFNWLTGHQDGYANHDPSYHRVVPHRTNFLQYFSMVRKLVTKDKNGPWMNKRDTIYVEVKRKNTV